LICESNTKVVAELVKQVLSERGSLALQAHGDSMRPTIEDGSLIELHPVSTDVQLGSVVMISAEDKLLLHRAVGFDCNDKIITKGDNLPTVDAAFDRAAVIGEVIACRTGTAEKSIKPMTVFEGRTVSQLSLLCGRLSRTVEKSGQLLMRYCPQRLRNSSVNRFLFNLLSRLFNTVFSVVGRVTRNAAGGLQWRRSNA